MTNDLVVQVVNALATSFVGYFIYRLNFNQRVRDKANREATNDVKETLERTTKEQAIATNAAAKKVEEVKDTLENSSTAAAKKLDSIAIVTNSTHAFANARMGVKLKKIMELQQRLAKLTQLDVDEEEAKNASSEFAEHETAQKVVDSLPGTDDQKKGVIPK
jgi:hypothetical protein